MDYFSHVVAFTSATREYSAPIKLTKLFLLALLIATAFAARLAADEEEEGDDNPASQCKCTSYTQKDLCPPCEECEDCPECPEQRSCESMKPTIEEKDCPDPCPKKVECPECPSCECGGGKESKCEECPEPEKSVDGKALNVNGQLKVPNGYKFDSWQVAYYKLYLVPEDWYHAQETCEIDGGHLVIPNARSEINVLRALFSKYDKKINGIWSGMHDLRTDEVYETVGGTNIKDEGFPDWSFHGVKLKEQGGCMALKYSGYFDDELCADKQYAYVCELPKKK